MSAFTDRVSVITGAGSGIGRALARELAARGSHLALCDIDAESLALTADEVARTGRRVTHTVVNVADREAVHAFADATIAAHGRVDAVVNNAGVSVAQTFVDTTYEDMEWIVGINFWGVVHGSKAFLPHLVQRNDGWVVNVSSVFGIIGVPCQSMYNATKFAVRGMTEAIRHELRGTNICVSCVHPGGIKTSIVRNSRVYRDPEGNTDRETIVSRSERMFGTTPESAARTIADGMQARKHRILIGADAHIIDRAQRAMPVRCFEVLYPLARRLRDFSSRREA